MSATMLGAEIAKPTLNKQAPEPGVPASTKRYVHTELVSSLSPKCKQVSQRTLGVELAISLFDSFPDPFDAAQDDYAAAANIATPSGQVRNDSQLDEEGMGWWVGETIRISAARFLRNFQNWNG